MTKGIRDKGPSVWVRIYSMLQKLGRGETMHFAIKRPEKGAGFIIDTTEKTRIRLAEPKSATENSD